MGSQPKLLFTIDEASEILGLSRTRVYGLIEAGDLKVFRLGKAVRIHRPELEAWLDRLAAGQGQGDRK
jgi:excisionase family DNA binding protein